MNDVFHLRRGDQVGGAVGSYAEEGHRLFSFLLVSQPVSKPIVSANKSWKYRLQDKSEKSVPESESPPEKSVGMARAAFARRFA